MLLQGCFCSLPYLESSSCKDMLSEHQECSMSLCFSAQGEGGHIARPLP